MEEVNELEISFDPILHEILSLPLSGIGLLYWRKDDVLVGVLRMLRLVLVWMGAMVMLGMSWPAAAAIFDRFGRRLSEQRLNYNAVDWQLLEPSATYSGVGLIKIQGLSTCTGFFIQPIENPQAPAYVLTNAHCIDLVNNLPNATEIIVDRPLQRLFRRDDEPLTFTPNYFAPVGRSRRSYGVKKVVYATMKNNDVAVLELSITQGDLLKTGIKPLTIAPLPSLAGEKIEVVGVPGIKVPFDRRFLHRSTCLLGPTVKVQEGIYQWNQALRHHCSIVNGMSGSPMLAQGQVVGIINTGGTEPATDDESCTLDNPCEKQTNGGVLPSYSANYGQLIDRLPRCFDAQGIFSLMQPTCQLEKP